MRLRYPVALGLLSTVLAVLAVTLIVVRARIIDSLAPYYESSDFDDPPPEVELMQLEQTSWILYEIVPWSLLAAVIPTIVAVALVTLRPKRPAPGR